MPSDQAANLQAAAEQQLDQRYRGDPSGRVHLRDTNPNLYRSMLTVAVIFVCLGANFLLTTPTFEQFGIPKNVIGLGFLSIGLSKLFFLLVRRNVRAMRVLCIVGMAYMFFWGMGTAQTFFEGESSLQLFVLYWGMAAMQISLLLELYFNPVTANGVVDDD